MHLENVRAHVSLENGLLQQDELSGQVVHSGAGDASPSSGSLRGARLIGNGDLRVTAPYPSHASADLRPFHLADMQRLPPQLRSPVAVTGRFQAGAQLDGTLNPERLSLVSMPGACWLRCPT
jgi:hypothetical protein